MKYVYMIKNRANGRAYIGVTQSVEHRMKNHFDCLKGNRHIVEDLQSDYDQYGKDAFFVSVIGQFNDDEASRMETFYQHIFRTNERKFGYNYKDKKGTGKNAVACRWRENVGLWTCPPGQWGYLKKLWSIPIKERQCYNLEKYQAEGTNR